MNRITLTYAFIALSALLVFVYFKIRATQGELTHLYVTSSAFSANQEIPTLYTCQGEDSSPELHIYNIPARTKSLALIVDDPDAPDPENPQLTWVHWIVFNVPPNTQEIPAGFGKQKSITAAFPSAREGLTNWNGTQYGGPCPPRGTHRYYFKLYALDTMLDLGPSVTKDMLLQAMQDHVLAQAQLIGTYKKQ